MLPVPNLNLDAIRPYIGCIPGPLVLRLPVCRRPVIHHESIEHLVTIWIRRFCGPCYGSARLLGAHGLGNKANHFRRTIGGCLGCSIPASSALHLHSLHSAPLANAPVNRQLHRAADLRNAGQVRPGGLIVAQVVARFASCLVQVHPGFSLAGLVGHGLFSDQPHFCRQRPLFTGGLNINTEAAAHSPSDLF